MVKSTEQMIKEKLGDEEGQKLIDRINTASTAEELANILKEYESKGQMSVLIFVVWSF